YPTGTSNAAFITSVYENLFNRAPDAAGLAYWDGELQRGVFTKSEFILAAINGAQNTAEGNDLAMVENKTEVGLAFADAGFDSVADAKNYLANVTDDDATVAAALASFYSKAPVAHPTRTQAQLDAATVLSGDITSSMTLTSDKVYRISGTTKVKNGATITIQPGTVVFGAQGEDVLVFTKGTKIMADGSTNNPVIFTSETALLDPENADAGQWGGLTILGQAPTNQANPHYEIDESDADYAFGGTNENDYSGVLRNVYVLNSGETIGTDLEINGLSLCGVGSATVVENIYIENSSDDCIEVWGGSVDITNATMKNCQDDSFDLDFGWSGTATNIVVQQTEVAHAGFEISSGGSAPMTSGKIVNFTINKANGSDEGGIYIKDDTTAPTFVNGIVTTYGTDAALNAKKAMTANQKAAIAFKDVTLNNPTTTYGGSGATDAQQRFEADDASY
ncbi:MAG: hypothetical protein QG560_1275, partial [Campylobacterota bacterium]|nr:hypothetical protein [Campylobacterota bacterium]